MAPGDDLFRNRYRVPSTRLKGWDYRLPGYYYVTICVLDRVQCLGEVVNGESVLSPGGEAVAREWGQIPQRNPQVTLDAWIVMPDHLHGLLLLSGKDSQPLGGVIGQFKSKTTKILRSRGQTGFTWQERFHDTILRDLKQLDHIRAYIRDNPRRWQRKRS
ncbi:MAG TPA: transposase [Thermoanaerobaculia bacterium]|nr:transposase [Thermoanaerobaculia bacterium]